jgi:phage regulator Rha-like protein
VFHPCFIRGSIVFRLVKVCDFEPAERVALYTLLGMPVPSDDQIAADANYVAEGDPRRKGRDVRFRIEVVAAYNYTCALTGLRLTTISAGAIVDAAHILIRGLKVLLDSDLAELYGVETFNLNKAVKRNADRFPDDFMFQLSTAEVESLRFRTGISKPAGRGGRRYRPYAFTEQGVAMLSSVLRSKRAVQVNIAIMRAFVRLREILATHKDLARKLDDHERRLGEHDHQIQVVFEAIRQLMAPPPAPKRRRIGFVTDTDDSEPGQVRGLAKRRRAAKLKE